MKSIETLDQEAKQAREDAVDALDLNALNKALFVNRLIEAAVAMVTYQFALGMQEVEKDATSANFASVQNDGIGKLLLEVSQEERDSDGWIDWNGGDCPVKQNEIVEVKFRWQAMMNEIDLAGVYRWHHGDKSGLIDGDPNCDIIAYRIVKGK